MHTFNQCLPLLVPFVPGETAFSLASRLARRNGIGRLVNFCSDVGLNYKELIVGDGVQIERLAMLAAVDADELKFWTPRVLERGWFQLGKAELKFTSFTRNRTKVCPQCLKEDRNLDPKSLPAHRGIWQLNSIRSCHIHNCTLQELPASNSGKPQFDFAEIMDTATITPGKPLDPATQEFEKHLVTRITGTEDSSWFGRLPFHVASQTAENLGAVLLYGPDRHRDTLTSKEWIDAGAHGYTNMRYGAWLVKDALVRFQRKAPIDHTFYRTRFKLFFDWLRERDEDPAFDVIRDLVREFVFTKYPIPTGSVVLGKPCPKQTVFTISKAIRTFGISQKHLGMRLEDLGIAQIAKSGKSYELKRYIDEDLILKIKTDIEQLQNASETSDELGMHYLVLRQLSAAGLIKKFFSSPKASPLYHPKELERFRAQFRELDQDQEITDGWEEIATAAKRFKCPIAKAVNLILEHKLPLRRNSKHSGSFSDLCVNIYALSDLLRLSTANTLSLGSASSQLDINMRALNSLIDLRLLRVVTTKDVDGPDIRTSIDSRSFDQFRRDHISLKELALQNDRPPDEELSRCLEIGAIPLDLKSRNSIVFRRSDVI